MVEIHTSTGEKEFNRLRDELSEQRRALPWENVEKEYVFAGPNGNETLAQLFGNCTQLIVYHFMFAPEWETGSSSCPSGPTISTASTSPEAS